MVTIKRKVIQIAKSTQLVSLPRTWAKRYNIQKGDELELEERESTLIISTDKATTQMAMVFDTKKWGPFQKNFLSAAYHLGYDEVMLHFDDEHTIEDIQERMKNCIGYEMVNQGKDFCEIKAISHALFSEFDQILKKSFLLVLTMGKNSYELITTKEYNRLKEVINLEETNNRLTDFCKRVLNKKGYQTKPTKTNIVYTISSDLERVADNYKFLCQYLVEHPITLKKESLVLYQEVNMLFEDYYKVFYKIHKKTFAELYQQQRQLKEKITKTMLSAPSHEMGFFHFLANINYLIYEMINGLVKLEL